MKNKLLTIFMFLLVITACNEQEEPSNVQFIHEDYTRAWNIFVGYASDNRVDLSLYPVTVIGSQEYNVRQGAMEIGIPTDVTSYWEHLHLLARGVGKIQGMKQNDNPIMESSVLPLNKDLDEVYRLYFAHKSFDKYQK